MDKIIIQVHKSQASKNQNREIIRISREAAQVLEELQRETGLSLRGLASTLIIQAAQIVEVQEVE